MDLAVFVAVAVLISAVAYAISFWITLWLLKFLVKNLNARYALTAIINAFLTPIGFAVRLPGLPKIATYIFIGLPILGLMYWRSTSRENRAT